MLVSVLLDPCVGLALGDLPTFEQFIYVRAGEGFGTVFKIDLGLLDQSIFDSFDVLVVFNKGFQLGNGLFDRLAGPVLLQRAVAKQPFDGGPYFDRLKGVVNDQTGGFDGGGGVIVVAANIIASVPTLIKPGEDALTGGEEIVISKKLTDGIAGGFWRDILAHGEPVEIVKRNSITDFAAVVCDQLTFATAVKFNVGGLRLVLALVFLIKRDFAVKTVEVAGGGVNGLLAGVGHGGSPFAPFGVSGRGAVAPFMVG